MRQYTYKNKNKRLYLVEIGRKDWEGDVIHYGYFANSPRQSVDDLKEIFKSEDGYNLGIKKFRILVK